MTGLHMVPNVMCHKCWEADVPQLSQGSKKLPTRFSPPGGPQKLGTKTSLLGSSKIQASAQALEIKSKEPDLAEQGQPRHIYIYMSIVLGQAGVLTLHLSLGEGTSIRLFIMYCICRNCDHNHTCHRCHKHDILAQALIRVQPI